MQFNWKTEYGAPPITANVMRLIFIALLAFFISIFVGILYSLAGVSVHRFPLSLNITFDSLRPEMLIQLFTHPFISAAQVGPGNALRAFIFVFFELMLLWFFGYKLELTWGGYNFLRLFFLGLGGSILMSALFALLLNTTMPVYGFTGGLAALMVAYIMIWPNDRILYALVIPMRMLWVVIVIVVLNLLLRDFMTQLAMHLGGGLAGAFFVYHYARKGRKQQSYGGGSGTYDGNFATSSGGGGQRGWGDDFSNPGPSANKGSTVTRGGGGPAGRVKEYFRKRRLHKKQEEINHRINLHDEVDRLLEKISREGQNSLSRKERKFLDEASKELRDRDQAPSDPRDIN